jgi:hypothetical protein
MEIPNPAITAILMPDNSIPDLTGAILPELRLVQVLAARLVPTSQGQVSVRKVQQSVRF